MSSPERRSALLLAAVMLAAATLRSPIVAVAPVAGAVQADLRTDAVVVGLFSSIPVLAFALCAPLAIAVVRRGGANFALSVSMIGAVLGCAVRSAGELRAVLLGTALIGVSLTIGNVAVPVVVSLGFPPKRVHAVTGVYIAAMNVGTMLVMMTTAPLSAVVGWRGAIAASAVFGLASLLAWVRLRGVRGALMPDGVGTARVAPPPDRLVPLRSGGDWLLAGAFAGQAFSFYAVVAWLPTLLVDGGFEPGIAGVVAGTFQVAGIAGALLIPAITSRFSVLTGVVSLTIGWLTVPIGALYAPELWWIWCTAGGVAQGGGLTVVFIMINAGGGGERAVTRRSGLVQGVGYACAALGPIAIGGLRQWNGTWEAPLLIVTGAIACFGVFGVAAAAGLRRPAGAAPAGADPA